MIALANKSTVHKNALWATGAEIVSRLILFVAILQLADYLGPTQYGELSYPFAIANICVMIADYGLTTYLVQIIAQNPVHTKDYLRQLFSLKIYLSVLALGCMVGISLLLHNVNMSLILIGGSALILNNTRMFFEAVFRAHHRLHLEALTKTSSAILLAGILVYLIFQHSTITTIASGYVIAAGISLLFTLLLLNTKIVLFQPDLQPWHWQRNLRLAWPFALSLGCNYLLNYFDSTVLGFFGKTQELGWYTAAYKPIFFLTALAGMIINAYFPAITEQYHHAREQLPITISRLLQITSLIAMPLIVGGMLLAPTLMHLLYPKYPTTALAMIFQILLGSTGLIYLWAPYGNSLQACQRPYDYLRGFGYAALFNIALNIMVIPYWGVYGAASATLLAQLFLVVYFHHKFQQQVVAVSLVHAVWRPALAATIMGVVLWLLPPSLWLIPLGAIIYAIVIYSLYGKNFPLGGVHS